jgi:PAS domain S-box-containing protein
MERLAQALIESAPDAIVVVDALGQILFANQAIGRMFGYGPGELVGKPVEVLVPGDRRAAHVTARQGFQRAPRVREMGATLDLLGQRADGSRFPVEIMLSPVTGDPRAHAVAVVRDVSRRRRAEGEARLWKRVADLSAVGVAVVPGDAGAVVAANPAFAAMHGFPMDELIGLPAELLVVDVERAAMGDLLVALGAGGHAVVRQRRLRRDGTSFPASVDVTVTSDRDPEHPDAILHVQDLTEEVRDDAERDRLLREAHASLAAREELVAIASHDIRSPLSGIRLQLQNVRHRLRKTDAPIADWTGERLGQIEESIDHLFGLLDSLLERHRREVGTLEFQYEEVDVAHLIHRIAVRMRPQFEQAEASLEVDADEQVVGRWDRLRVEQALTNLLVNALSYAAGAAVEIRVRRAGPRVEVAIVDRGPGIEPARLATLFDRGAGDGRPGSYGLGLWIAHRIVEAHGGEILVESETGRGTSFTVVLPLAPG